MVQKMLLQVKYATRNKQKKLGSYSQESENLVWSPLNCAQDNQTSIVSLKIPIIAAAA
jgi:hypothetical protein